MKKIVFMLALMVVAMSANAQKVITENLYHPESMLRDGDFLFASEIGKELAPREKDGDGGLYKLDLHGKIVDQKFNKSPLNAAKGIVVIGNLLYVNDIDRIVAFDKNTGEQKDEINLSELGSQFLNDLAIKDNKTLFVSATDLGKVFTVDLVTKKAVALDVPEIKGPNGLAYDQKKKILYVVGLTWDEKPEGAIGMIEFKGDKPAYSKILDITGAFDGLQMIDENTLVVSDWISIKTMQARLLLVDVKKKSFKEIYSGGDAADIFYDAKTKTILAPGLKEGKLFEYYLSK